MKSAIAIVLVAASSSSPRALERRHRHRQHVNEVPAPKTAPRVVTPGASPGAAPSDAIVLFDGKDLSQWESEKDGSPALWTVADGVATVKAGSGGIRTKRGFGDVQLHIEWATPAEVKGEGQERGNSGVFLQSTYELQVLDSYQNETYCARIGRIDLQAARAARERVTEARRVADLRRHLPRARVRQRRQGDPARAIHRAPQRRADPGQRRGHGRHDPYGPSLLQGPPGQDAAGSSGSRHADPIPQHLDPRAVAAATARSDRRSTSPTFPPVHPIA